MDQDEPPRKRKAEDSAEFQRKSSSTFSADDGASLDDQKLAEKREYNRQNAARARQRVKNQLTDLSSKVESFSHKNQQLEVENTELRSENQKLRSENLQLRQYLSRLPGGLPSSLSSGGGLLSSGNIAMPISWGGGAGGGLATAGLPSGTSPSRTAFAEEAKLSSPPNSSLLNQLLSQANVNILQQQPQLDTNTILQQLLLSQAQRDPLANAAQLQLLNLESQNTGSDATPYSLQLGSTLGQPNLQLLSSQLFQLSQNALALNRNQGNEPDKSPGSSPGRKS